MALAGVLVGGVILLGVAIGYWSVRSYLKSEGFREMLEEEAGAVLDGEARLSAFQWDGWDVKTGQFSFQGEEGLENLRASELSATVDLAAIWGGRYRLENVQLKEVEILGDFTKKMAEGAADLDERKKSAAEERGEGFWGQFLPDEIALSGLHIDEVNGRAVTDDGIWSWKGMSATAYPGSGQRVYDLELKGGEIRTPLEVMNRLAVEKVHGRYSGDRFYLLSSTLKGAKRSRVEVTGGFDLGSGSWELDGSLVDGRTEDLIEEDWKKKLLGGIQLSFRARGRPEREATVQGEIILKDGLLTALPVLDRIAAYAESARFRRLGLSEASCRFDKRGRNLELNEILVVSEGLLRIEGQMRLSGEDIVRGKLELGITPGTLSHIPGAESKVFLPGRKGLLWTPVQVSGTLSSPREDLSERLIAAAGERMFELIPETGQLVLRQSGQVVTDSTRLLLKEQGVVMKAGNQLLLQGERELLKGTDRALEVGEEVVEEGVDRLFDLLGGPSQKRE